ncbi:FAD-binding domain-containing protein [Rhizoctonia solani]|nr:FAD-binding domain-containing protein [Rhizoctonia solani]
MVYYFTIGPLLALVTSTIFGVRTQESNATWAISAKFRNAGAAPVTGISRVPKAVWSVLNEIVEGRLYNNGAPFSQPCFRNGSSATSCSTIQSNYVNNVFRANNYGAYMMTQWEGCQKTHAYCQLDWSDPFSTDAITPPASCAQGSINSYYVDVRHPLDVMAAFVLSHITSIPLVIKNSGHDYKGRSSTPNGLTLWTHNIRYPHTCPSVDATPAITYGAGQDFASLYEFAEANGVTFLGGTDKTVGAAGGWLQGGGHGILSNTLGLGVDRVLQFKVVTPDGILRTANACQNSDLFWALRGGGGGTFGVVLEGTSRVEKKITTQVIYVKFKPVAAHVVAYMQTILENSVKWARDGWGGYVSADHAIYATPKLSRPEAEASMAPLTQVVASFGSDMLANMFTTYESFLPLFNTVVAAGTAPVGRPFAMATRIIPSTNFITPEGRSTLLNATLSAFNMVGGAAQILATTPYSYNCTSATDVSVTPAWRNAIWHVILAGFWNYNSTAEQQAAVYRTVSTAADKLRVITPGSGAYQNEADVSEPDHENSFWGPNYDRLVAIKKKYDPNGLLDCWHCINWKGAGNERYQCYTQSG